MNAYIIFSGYITVIMLPLGEAMAICMSGPIFTAILARIFLQQRFMLWKIFFGIGIFAGLVLVIQPTFLFPELSVNARTENLVLHDDLYYIGAIIGCSCAVITGVSAVVLSGTAVNHVSTYVLVLYAALAAVVIAACSVPFNPRQTLMSSEVMNISTNTRLLYLAITLGAVISNLCTIKSFHMTDPTTIIVLHQSEVLIGFLIQVYLMNEWSNTLSFAGSGLVVLGVIMITLEEGIVSRLPECCQKWL